MTKKLKPFKHQEQALAFLDAHPRAGLFLEQGLGKTMTALWSAERHKARRLIIVAPPVVCESVWRETLVTHFAGQWAIFMPYRYIGARRELVVKDALAQNSPKAIITTYDSFLRFEKELERYNADFVIFDEATALKHVSAKRTRIALKFTRHTPRVILATGTPVTNSPMDLHGLGCFIAPSEISSRVTWFRDRVMRRGFGEFEWIPRQNWHKVECVSKILEHCLFMKLRDAVDLPPVTTVNVKVPLTDEQKIMLLELRTMAMTYEGAITAANTSRLRNAVLQISAGVVRADDDSPYTVRSRRIEYLKEIIDEADSQVIVFSWHTIVTELLSAELDAPCIYGTVPPAKRNVILDAFKNGEFKVLVANPQTIGHGVDLTNANRIIFAQLPDSLEFYLQAISRADRIGQKHPVVVYNLYSTAENTILRNLLTKKGFSDTIDEYRAILDDAIYATQAI